MISDTGSSWRISAANLGAPFLELLPISGLAISVLDGSGQQSTILATDLASVELEEIHFDLGEGPLFDSFRSEEPELLPDVQRSAWSRWPAFAEAIAPLDVGSIFVFPLLMGAVCVGVVVTYRVDTGALGPAAVERGCALARAIAGPALDRAIGYADADPSDSPSVEMRRDVHQATGMVLVQLDTNATDAFARIRAHAFLTGRTVREVARDVIARTLNFSTLHD